MEDVCKAYRKLSLKVHPDKNKAPGAEEAFKAVSKYFQCLSNEESSKMHDISGSDDPAPVRRNRHAHGHGLNCFYDTDGDAVSIFGSSHIWVDQCSLSNCADGFVDAVMGSSTITIYNNYFTHHNEVMLLGHSDSYDKDKVMQVTIAFNHFGGKAGSNVLNTYSDVSGYGFSKRGQRSCILVSTEAENKFLELRMFANISISTVDNLSEGLHSLGMHGPGYSSYAVGESRNGVNYMLAQKRTKRKDV